MTQRVAFLCHDLDAAAEVVARLQKQGYSEDNIYVITKDDIVLEDLPEADPRQASNLLPALKRGAGVGGSMGLFAGLMMAVVPVAGLAVSGAAVAAMTGAGAAFGAWTSSMIGISVPNSKLEEFQQAVDNGRSLVLVDVEDIEAEQLMKSLEAYCASEILRSEPVEII